MGISGTENNYSIQKEFCLEFSDEDGFSTAGMVLALLITLSLLFTTAQVYQINSASADIQNIADMTALAAENEVAEFYVVAHVCDALVLSLSLAGVVVTGIGVIALCVPPLHALGETFINAGTKIFKARDDFSEKAARSLNSVQKSVPFLSVVSASALASASGGGQMNSSYTGVAVVLPLEGEQINFDDLEGSSDFIEEININKDELKEASNKAEEAAARANEYKEKAFAHDCGNNPNYCMYERAGHLSGLASSDNPLYQSVDTWSFSVALKRAQAYYLMRAQQETPSSPSPREQARSSLRARFYAYASDEIAKGYVKEEGDSFESYFPRMPKNTDEMRKTSLYTEAVYPVSEEGGKFTMHAYEQCPGLMSGRIGLGSAEQSESKDYSTCTYCDFSATNLGSVAAASTSIENGFEYHYDKVADAAELYTQARKEFQPHASAVKDVAGSLFGNLTGIAKDAASKRIQVKPPGRYGAVSFVVSTKKDTPSASLLSSFVGGDSQMGVRTAISGAALVKAEANEGKSILSDLLAGVSNRFDSGFIEGAQGLLAVWSNLLLAYSNGQDSLRKSLEEGLDGVPLMSESGLGTWASNAFSQFMESVGLEPVELSAPRPVLVNSQHVAAADESEVGKRILSLKEGVGTIAEVTQSGGVTEVISGIGTFGFESINWEDSKITLATIEPFGEAGPKMPLTVAIPPAVKEGIEGTIGSVMDDVGNTVERIIGGRRWE